MGIRGAALASAVIADHLLCCFFIVYTYGKIDLKKYGLNRFGHFDWDMVMRILRISCFTMVQYFLSMAIWFVFFMAWNDPDNGSLPLPTLCVAYMLCC